MQIHLLTFGQATDITGSCKISMNGITDTDQLTKRLKELYPELGNIDFVIAVDKKIIKDNTAISEASAIAVLPPFSGG